MEDALERLALHGLELLLRPLVEIGPQLGRLERQLPLGSEARFPCRFVGPLVELVPRGLLGLELQRLPALGGQLVRLGVGGGPGLLPGARLGVAPQPSS